MTAGVLGLGEAAIGLINSSKAKKKAAQLNATRPKLTSSPYLKDALALSESELSTGMSADAKTAYEEGLDKDQSSAFGTITRIGGTPNNVSSVYGAGQPGRARLAIMKDQIRMNNLNRLIQVQTASEDDREKDFQFDQWMPWADSAQANAQAKETAQSEIFSGLSTAAGGAMRFGEKKSSQNDFEKYLTSLSRSTPSNNSAPAASSSNNSASTVGNSFLDSLLTNDE